jgi:hypothetical protein
MGSSSYSLYKRLDVVGFDYEAAMKRLLPIFSATKINYLYMDHPS